MGELYFTLTAGRTGSNWLADFLTANTPTEAFHERRGIKDFGVHMPDIRIMRSFNTFGLDSDVREFWQRKLDLLPQDALYAETNHTLGKCGLIESLATHERAQDACIFILRRDMAKQCASYVRRGDFRHLTSVWQWYLSQTYPNNIVPFETFGGGEARFGAEMWYTCEMACRQYYYQTVYASYLKFIPVELETVTTALGARALLEQLGYSHAPILPSKVNHTPEHAMDELAEQFAPLRALGGAYVEKRVKDFIAQGRSLVPGGMQIEDEAQEIVREQWATMPATTKMLDAAMKRSLRASVARAHLTSSRRRA